MAEHISVLKDEAIKLLNPAPGKNFIDGTLGLGGHAEEILKRTSPNGKLIGFDLDPEAIALAGKRLRRFKSRVLLVNDNFKKLKQKYNESRFFDQCHGLLLDLGLSSAQLADQKRGFSFLSPGELLMNFGETEMKAIDILNEWSERELTKIFQEYGGEKLASRIAKKIVEERTKQKQSKQKWLTANQLSDLILEIYKNKRLEKIHPATRVFQALRIAVNDELNNLKEVLPNLPEVLVKGGRIVIISFHSLEDRRVKDFFRQESRDCLCPPELPECRCGHEASLKVLTKKPLTPSTVEILNNPRSRSAKMRAAEKI